MQQPPIAVQSTLPPSQLSIGTALFTFTQFFAGAIFVAGGQTAFTNSLGPALDNFAPAVNASTIINVGATALRDTIPPTELRGVLKVYNQALIHTFVSEPLLFIFRARTILKAQLISCGRCGCCGILFQLGNGMGQCEKGKRGQSQGIECT